MSSKNRAKKASRPGVPLHSVTIILCLTASVAAQVPYDRLKKPAAGDWLTYSGNFAAHRYSPLAEITPANAGSLRTKWVYQSRGRGQLETSPVVADGVMYVTEPPTTVVALDLRMGRPLWRYERQIPRALQTLGFGRVNRGVAVLDDMIYVGTLDAHMVALDARSGAVRWDTEVADYKLGHCIT